MKTLKTTLAAMMIMLTSVAATAQPMNPYAIRSNARFLTDRMAYTLGLSAAILDDLYCINYDYIYGVNDYLDDVALGYRYDDYMAVVYARDYALRRLLTERQWALLMTYDYFYRPISFINHRWSFGIYLHDRHFDRFYYHAPRRFNDYRGGHFFGGMRPGGGVHPGPGGRPGDRGPAGNVNPNVNRTNPTAGRSFHVGEVNANANTNVNVNVNVDPNANRTARNANATAGINTRTSIANPVAAEARTASRAASVNARTNANVGANARVNAAPRTMSSTRSSVSVPTRTTSVSTSTRTASVSAPTRSASSSMGRSASSFSSAPSRSSGSMGGSRTSAGRR